MGGQSNPDGLEYMGARRYLGESVLRTAKCRPPANLVPGPRSEPDQEEKRGRATDGTGTGRRHLFAFDEGRTPQRSVR